MPNGTDQLSESFVKKRFAIAEVPDQEAAIADPAHKVEVELILHDGFLPLERAVPGGTIRALEVADGRQIHRQIEGPRI